MSRDYEDLLREFEELRVETNRILDRQSQIVSQLAEREVTGGNQPAQRRNSIRVGDSVRITNGVTTLLGRAATEDDRIGVVVETKTDRAGQPWVTLVNRHGRKIRRATKNVRLA